jgi:voltage-gated potassium channel
MVSVNENNNFFYFTLALVVLLLSSALVDTMPPGEGRLLMRFIILGTEVVAFVSLNMGASWRRFIGVMVVLIILTSALDELTDLSWTPIPGLLSLLIFFLGLAVGISKRALFSGIVDANTIVGALSVYLLIGLIWATLYLLSLEFFPLAFNGIERENWSDNFSNAVYFSFVTMTSLGYGDVSPALPITRALAYLQAIAGAFYMAIVVASLIGARTSHQKNPVD